MFYDQNILEPKIVLKFNSYCSKWPFSYKCKYFIAISNVIFHNYLVITLFVIVSVIIFLFWRTLNFLSPDPQKVYLLVIKDLSLFEVGQLIKEKF